MTATSASKRLKAAEARYVRALGHSEQARQDRDESIRDAVAAGHTHADIYRILDGAITRARIGQIALQHSKEGTP